MATRERDAGTLADLTAHASGPERGSDRGFGLLFMAVFLIIACWPLVRAGPVRLWALAIAALFLVIAVAAPRLLSPLNWLWMQLGLLLGRIVSPVVLFLVYCIAVVPTGLLMRLAGKDPLHRKFDAQLKTYWIPRVPVGKPDRTMTNQF